VRLLAGAARIDHALLTTGYVRNDDEWNRISAAWSRLAESGLSIDESSSTTVFDVRAKARRLKGESGLDLIIIDYLQLMRGAQRAENKNLEIAEISRSLKAIAKDLNVPLILLSQLSRAPEQRGEHRPQLSDLRDSGAIEQDADVVLFIYRDEKYKTTPENAGVAEIIIAKQRNGPTGTVRVVFLEELTRFENLAADSTKGPNA
jgi:replicative DNA helicase